MPIEFKRATRDNRYVRMALTGPTGAGKTLTALRIARGLGGSVCVIDTENDTAGLYADRADVPAYDVYNLRSFKPAHYCQCIDTAAELGYGVCIIDTLSRVWNDKGGILEIAGGDIRGWKAANPEYQRLVQTIMGYNRKMHIIVTLREKIEYRLEPDSTGKITVVSHGLQPIIRDEFVYEPDIIGALDQDHVLRFDGVGKTRCDALSGRSFANPVQT